MKAPFMIRTALCMILFCFLSESTSAQHKAKEKSEKLKIEAALSFINDYLEFDHKGNEVATVKWMNSNPLLTAEFKTQYKALIAEARKEEPELGLDFDPIFDAQDYPDEGFEFLKFDSNDYVIVRGIDWPQFTVIIRMAFLQNKWMVTGAGVINIAKNRQRVK
jgi:hypothetical protein